MRGPAALGLGALGLRGSEGVFSWVDESHQGVAALGLLELCKGVTRATTGFVRRSGSL